MPGSLDQRIVDHLQTAGDSGLSMGALVDHFVEDGADEAQVEASIWRLLELRRVTPHGYVRRVLRTGSGEGKTRRSYELVLRPWSPELDGQLDLALDAS
jgi:hypothetical protein